MFSPLIVFGQQPYEVGLPCTKCPYAHECVMGQCKEIGKSEHGTGESRLFLR